MKSNASVGAVAGRMAASAVVAAIAALAWGCSNVPLASQRDPAVDEGRVAQVEHEAAGRGIGVYWVNPPTRRNAAAPPEVRAGRRHPRPETAAAASSTPVVARARGASSACFRSSEPLDARAENAQYPGPGRSNARFRSSSGPPPMPSSHFAYRAIRLASRRAVVSVACSLPLAFLAGCGGGSSDNATATAPAAATQPTVAQLANICTPAGEKAWISAYLNDVYLFYRDIVAVDPAAYATQEDYFNALLVHSKDRFSFVEPQSVADAFFSAGQDVGYGAVFKLDAANNLRIGFVDATGPLAAQSVGRGAQVVTLNGTALASLSTDQLNALLFPTAVGVQLSLTVLDLNQTVARTVVVSSANVVEDPVPLARVLPSDPADAASPKIGYLLFNEQIATSEAELINAIMTFRSAGVADVVIDLRYNGGGYLYIAQRTRHHARRDADRGERRIREADLQRQASREEQHGRLPVDVHHRTGIADARPAARVRGHRARNVLGERVDHQTD